MSIDWTRFWRNPLFLALAGIALLILVTNTF